WIALGSMSRIALPLRRIVIICADDDPLHHADPRKSAAARALAKAVRYWRDNGVWVCVAAPTPQRRQDKSDFNDLLSLRARRGAHETGRGACGVHGRKSSSHGEAGYPGGHP